MTTTKKEADFAKQIYGATVEDIVTEHAELVTHYREHVLTELSKTVCGELGDAVSPAYVEYRGSS